MILTIRTDKPLAEIGLYAEEERLSFLEWEAHRQLAETLHNKIDGLLAGQNIGIKELRGIIVYAGPGSFTGLRIGLSVANAIAYAEQLPIVGTTGEEWVSIGLGRLNKQENDKMVIPEYGAPVHITEAKK